ncbi:formate dehydrogenase accessory sulfurtransferase FdhD [Salinicola rhizosphaerae]|uniref:Sulfurtransferase FdhD n=1 Tax=Salinicola rhizosphaerae TaxID=1443141 RepID=A0ABQ3EER2_9GAMM|nr:formate dehydrogenase accessory sulfurtransferase FdhD [Salinicola rhizosphaerae]GHB32441.1 sulfurtransferase FdhD [Salinicola rhizosphaerae]
MPEPSQQKRHDSIDAVSFDDASSRGLNDLPGPVESPISLVFNDTAYATLLATPDQLDYLAIGFAHSEGLIDRREEVEAIQVERSRHGFRVRLEVSARIARRAAGQSRATLSTSGCGACGVQEESQLLFGLTRLPSVALPSPVVLASGLRALDDEAAAGMHLALSLDVQGQVMAVGRDIGRHNALDKVIGQHLARSEMPSLILTSSRCSLELVQKSVRAGVPALATLSYPSRLAVEVARSCNLTLINCHRGRRLELLSRGDA